MEPSEKEMVEELQKTVDELQDLLRLKEEKIGELEDYTQSLERQQEVSEAHIKSLEETIARQDELIGEMDGFSKDSVRGGEEEVSQLTEILEAQEQSLADQRSIIEEQNKLIEELSRAMQNDDEERPLSEGTYVPTICEGKQVASSSRGPSTETTPRGPPAPRMARSDPTHMPTSRLSPREMLLKRPTGGANPHAGAPQPTGTPGAGPTRPRPNSAFSKEGPRAKSLGAYRDRSGQEAELVRRPLPKQPTTCTAQAGGRSNGRRYPPALPILEQKV